MKKHIVHEMKMIYLMKFLKAKGGIAPRSPDPGPTSLCAAELRGAKGGEL